MQLRSLLLALLAALAAGAIGCGHGPGGTLMVDTPALAYQAPDIDEITGIDSSEEQETEPAPAPPPSASAPAAKPAAAPAAPAKK